jgi:hypothetical protein
MRTLIAFLGVLLLSALALADVASGVQQLDVACANRIAAIGDPPASKKEANEAKNLQKARDKLALYDGNNTVAMFKKVAAAAKFVFVSATDDAAVLAGVTTIVEGFAQGADKRLDSAASQLSQLIDPKHAAVVDAAMDALEKFVEKGRNSIQANPLKASALLITAYDQLGLVIAKAKKLVEAEAGSPPPAGLTVVTDANSGSLMNAGPAFYDISKIRVFAIVTSNGSTVKTYAGESAKSVIPGLFAVKGTNRIAAATSFDLTAIYQGLVPAGTMSPRVAGVFQVTLKGEPFFNVFFDVMLP